MPKQAKISGQITNREGLAGILGSSVTTVDRYLRAGMPGEKRGKEHEINTAAAIRWLLERVGAPGDIGQAEDRRRETAARAGLAEMKLAEKRGALIAIDEVAAVVADELARVRSRLLEMPARLAQGLVGFDARAIERAIDDEVRGVLTELSQS
jgi:phage terminase Nu1 subunit (DNA packaging protein)